MSLKSAIENAKARVSASFDAVVAKGGTRPSADRLSFLPSAIESIPSGGGDRISPSQIYFQFGGNNDDFDASVIDWSKITSMDNAFLYSYYKKVKGFNNESVPKNTSLYQAFPRMTNLVEFDLTGMTGENVTTCRAMCVGNVSMEIVRTSFVFGKNTSLYQTFKDCYKLRLITGMENWDTRTVTDMRSVFSSCYVLESIDLTNFECGSLLYFEQEGGIIPNASSLTNLIGNKTLADVRNGVVVMHNLVRSFDTRISPLNFASMLAICKGVGTAPSSVTLTLNRNAYNQLTEDEKTELDTAIAGKNWVIATA